ncbi:MAG: AMP-binding protein [Pseudomonadota bacterium]
MTSIRNLADIQSLEQQPYDSAIPARTTYGLIASAAARFPDRNAFTFLPDGDLQTAPRQVTYRELLSQVHRAANLFRSMGAGPDDAVAILAPNIPETQFALWGAQLASKACPINYLLQPDHIAALIEASGAKLVVTIGPNQELDIWSTVQKVLALKALPVLQIHVGGAVPPGAQVFQDLLATQPETLAFDPQLTPGRIAACFHTGGTTGAPKLAQHTHGNEAHTSWFAPMFYGFDENTVEVNGFPLFHVAGAFVYGLSMLAVGGTQVLPTLSGMRNPVFARNYWKFCERERVTALACVPTILATLVNTPVDADISRIRVAYTGGSPLPTELAAQFESRTGIAVRNILGMTECAGLVSIEPFAAPRVPGSTGLRLPFSEVRIVPLSGGAADLDGECDTGETGVLVLRGPHVSPGYTDAARNAGMFDSGWLVSGDLGHVDAQGYLHVTGRAKDVIIRGSHNLDPGLIEDAFLAHPAVALCAVVSEPDAYAGELPVAFVTLRPGAVVEPAELLAAVTPHVYERPAVPKRVTVIDVMPVTAIGKIYKPALRQRAIEAKLLEMLGGLDASIRVTCEERGARLVAVVRLPGVEGDALALAVKEKLVPISVSTELVFD